MNSRHDRLQPGLMASAFEMPTDRAPAAPAAANTPTQPITETPADQANHASFDAKQARQFLLGGHAIVTIAGKSSRYTFSISISKDLSVYFIALLTGPDNTTDYTYVGLLDVDRGRVRLTRKSRYTEQTQPVVALNWALGHIWAGRDLPAPARMYHVGRCGRCGRALTVPASIESGFGPECLGKLDGGHS